MEIKFISVHHFGGLANDPYASTQNLTLNHINQAHKARWPDFPSELNGSFMGYHLIIWPSGDFTQGRYIGEPTAAQKGYNYNTFSPCLAGNFTKGVDKPTEAQKATLKAILKAATSTSVFPDLWKLGIKVKNGTKLNISMFRIYPHRAFQTYTQCYGQELPDDWARNLLFDEYSLPTRNILKFIQNFWFSAPSQSLGSQLLKDKNCAGFI